jgi:caffeoyl-CoA O-methyltransferase
MLVRLVGARTPSRSALPATPSIHARGLPADGRLLCCDVSEDWTTIARRWEPAGGRPTSPDRTGRRHLARFRPSAPDFAFIDADGRHPAYYEEIVTRPAPTA